MQKIGTGTWLLHQSDNISRHSNHNLLPDMYLCVPFKCVTTCQDSRLFQNVWKVTADKLQSENI